MDQAVIFDLDGTLLNTDLLIEKSFIHVFKKYKPEYILSKEELLSFLGPSLYETFSHYFKEDMIDELVDYYREYNHAHHKDFVTIYDGVIETLNKLKEKGYRLAIVTTKLKEAAFIGLDQFGIRKYFEVIIGHEEVKKGKPDPEGINRALALMNLKTGYYIGDNVTDMMAGKRAGVKTIGVKWSPKGYKQMLKEDPDFMIDEFHEIIDILKEE